MGVKLSLIIPYHNEKKSIIKPMMESLNFQMGIDWQDIEVIISNNCEEPKDMSSFIAKFTEVAPRIRYIECPIKAGMSQNRQFGLTQATGEYVMFCDCDDSLYSFTTLRAILNMLSSNKDLYHSSVIHEIGPKDPWWRYGMTVRDVPESNRLLHGRIYRRKFLVDHNIHLSSQIFAWEDIYFNDLVSMFSPVTEETKRSFYVWKYRDESVSHSDGTGVAYQRLHARDGLVRHFYKFEFAKNSNLPSEDFAKLFQSYIVNQYLDRFGVVFDTEMIEEFVSLMIQTFDPDFSMLRSIRGVTTLGEEDFITWIYRVASSHDKNEVDKKYNIGHITPYSYK